MIYAIAAEPAPLLKRMREQEHLGKAFVFLSDVEAKFGSLYAGKYPPGYLKPATIVVGKNGKIVFASSLEDITNRPAAEKVLAAIKN